jgi:3',5'-cyclic AMP phosphodiesterase CpdA
MRIVALSDQHGFLPDIPPCDLLIVTGDVCPDRFGPFMAVHDPYQQQAWFDRTVRPWLAVTPATHKVLTWGNHDWCGQMCSFRSDTPEHARSTDLHDSRGRRDECAVRRRRGWRNVRVGDALVQPVHAVGIHEAAERSRACLRGDPRRHRRTGVAPTTIRVRRQHFRRRVEHVGSRELLVAIERVRPRVVICGHVHGGFGRYEHQGIPIYNVSVVDESYRLVNAPTVIDLPDV